MRNGRPHIIGTTLTVLDIAIAHNYHALDANGIADDYDISLAQVHSALAYYYDHKLAMDEAIRRQIRKSERLMEQRIGSRYPSLLS